jgi:hypothetical protein
MRLCNPCCSITLDTLSALPLESHKREQKAAGLAHVLPECDLVRTSETCQLCNLILASVRQEEQNRGIPLLPSSRPYTLALRAKYDPPNLVFPSLENQDGPCLTGFTVFTSDSQDPVSGTIRLYTCAGEYHTISFDHLPT